MKTLDLENQLGFRRQQKKWEVENMSRRMSTEILGHEMEGSFYDLDCSYPCLNIGEKFYKEQLVITLGFMIHEQDYVID